MRWWNRPKMELNWFEPESPHLVQQTGTALETMGLKPYKGLFITLELTNNGKEIASDAEADLTRVAKKAGAGGWNLQQDWIPVPLEWVLGPNDLQRDLIPERCYLINLGSFSTVRKGQLLLTYTISPESQRETFEPGEHCFEVSISATGATPLRKYIYATFADFSGVTNPDGITPFIKKMELKDKAPW